MLDRIELDALLIGALYGELTPADEAVLTAHLESHPTDRTALADLTRTRAAVRDSRLLAVQLEPPQSISALLLQEASRRAPRSAARSSETASWFQRFVRSFMAHPAMAAAAMLVLVIGVAATLYVRDSIEVAAPATDRTRVHEFGQTKAETAAAPAPAAAAPSEPTGNAAPAAEPAAAPAADGIAAGSMASGNHRIDFDDSARSQDVAKAAVAKQAPAEKPKADHAGTSDEEQGALAKKKAAPEPPADKPARSAKSNKLAGIVVRTPELALKENDDERPQPARRQAAVPADRDVARAERGAGGAPAGGPPPATPTPPPTPSNTLDPYAASAAPATESTTRGRKPASAPAKPAPVAAQPPAQAVPPPPPPATGEAVADNRASDKASGAKDAKTVEQKPARDKAALDWARKQHGQVIALVGANNCRAAASAAIEIYSRAPDYYAANVVTDRSIRPCLPYLNSQREREDRARAAKNASMSGDTPAAAAPAPRPAAVDPAPPLPVRK